MMKLIILVGACALMAAAYEYTIPAAPCAWSVTEEYENRNQYLKTRYTVYGRYYKYEEFDRDNNLIYAYIRRPDYYNKGQSASFTFNGLACSVSYTSDSGRTYEVPVGFKTEDYPYIAEGKYNGHKCKIYYGYNDEYEPDMNYSAVYVDRDGYVIGKTSRLDDPKYRTTYNYSYSTFVTMNDFTFSKSVVYDCNDQRIFQTPKAYYAQCAASTTGAAVAVVIAAVVSALVSLVNNPFGDGSYSLDGIDLDWEYFSGTLEAYNGMSGSEVYEECNPLYVKLYNKLV